jgi:hypothetical protein
MLQGGLDSNKISGVGTNFELLVHVLPGPNKRVFCVNGDYNRAN